MKKLLFVLIFVLVLPFIAMADDDVPVLPGGAAIVESPEVAQVATDNPVWTFLNSPLGISIVVFLLSVIAGKIFTIKPAWKKYVIKYGPKLMQAVKEAEKRIPDDTENKGLARLDAALKYLLEIEPKLKNALDEDLKQAITAIHAKAETSGNLKKG